MVNPVRIPNSSGIHQYGKYTRIKTPEIGKKAINQFLSSLDNIDGSLKEFDATVFRGLCEKIRSIPQRESWSLSSLAMKQKKPLFPETKMKQKLCSKNPCILYHYLHDTRNNMFRMLHVDLKLSIRN